MAIKIFKQIQWQSNLVASLTHACSRYASQVGLLFFIVPGFFFRSPVVFFAGAATGSLLNLIDLLVAPFFESLSKAYQSQALKAQEYLDQIKADNSQGRQVMVFIS